MKRSLTPNGGMRVSHYKQKSSLRSFSVLILADAVDYNIFLDLKDQAL